MAFVVLILHSELVDNLFFLSSCQLLGGNRWESVNLRYSHESQEICWNAVWCAVQSKGV